MPRSPRSLTADASGENGVAEMRREGVTAVGSVATGILASACCIVPVVFTMLGLSGAAFAILLEPLRPYVLVLTYGLLGGAFYFAYRPSQVACRADGVCEIPRTNRLGRVLLWLAAAVVTLATTFPSYAEYRKAFLVWLRIRANDDATEATQQAATFRDGRLSEGWDADQKVCPNPTRFAGEVVKRLGRRR